MDLQKFFEKLPGEYRDWGSPFMTPLSDTLSFVAEKTESTGDRSLFPALNLAVECLESGEVYCQIGCFRRGALVSALVDRPDRFGYGVEAFFQYDPSGDRLAVVAGDIEEFGLEDRIFLSDRKTEDFFADLRELETEEKIGVYFYDGPEDYRSLLIALLHARDYLAERALIAIGKCDRPAIQQAIDDFLATEAHATVLLDRQLAVHGILGLKDLCLLAWNAPSGDLVLRSPKKLVLNVGCGPYNPDALPAHFRDGNWQEIRLDINPAVRPDILGTITDLSAVPDNSVDAIFSSHNLEHVYNYEVPSALAEFKRALKPDGSILMIVPDLQTVAERVARGDIEETLYISPAGPIRSLLVFYGMATDIPGIPYMAHKTGFTASSLTAKLQEAGFDRVQVTRSGFDLIARGFK
ncbi:methyltransferase domain-containing protein [Pannus brasiliensis CCIBt3594]|uniref:Methyltransferase domain-containing protein n=1 Tax=Pannus brasiliensis CCIBt3594 TaxID=1427578 RepID=A0AAW9QT64_9CHRO